MKLVILVTIGFDKEGLDLRWRPVRSKRIFETPIRKPVSGKKRKHFLRSPSQGNEPPGTKPSRHTTSINQTENHSHASLVDLFCCYRIHRGNCWPWVCNHTKVMTVCFWFTHLQSKPASKSEKNRRTFLACFFSIRFFTVNDSSARNRTDSLLDHGNSQQEIFCFF